MKTVRVVLSANEVVQALVNFAYDKTGRTEATHTGKVETMLLFGQLPDGSTFVEQGRVEMELPE